MCQLTVCSECPYRTNSPSGYFGGNDPAEYRQAIVSDTVVACHTRNNYNHRGMVDTTNLQPCIGHLSSQIKTCKSNRLPQANDLQQHIRGVVDMSNILSLWEFDLHHQVDTDTDR